MTKPRTLRRLLAVPLVLLGGAASGLLGVCGPFTDVTDATFCPYVFEIFTLGITTGTTPTTYSPSDNVSRLQMAAFLSRTVDGVLQRASRRAISGQYWVPQGPANLGLTTVGPNPYIVTSDGTDLWVSRYFAGTVSRVGGSDGKLLEVWTGVSSPYALLSAMGGIFVTGDTNPGNLYRISPSQPAGAATLVASNLAAFPEGIAFDGGRIWTGGSFAGVSIVTPAASIPWTATTVTTGIGGVRGILYDGSNVWVTGGQFLRKLDSAGAVLQTVTVGLIPGNPVFDGTNIWVPNRDTPSVSVVRASSGVVLATLTQNGIVSNGPTTAAFDGQRVLVTMNAGQNVALWKAADLTPLGSFSTGPSTAPFGACSDGLHFWIVLGLGGQLARF